MAVNKSQESGNDEFAFMLLIIYHLTPAAMLRKCRMLLKLRKVIGHKQPFMLFNSCRYDVYSTTNTV